MHVLHVVRQFAPAIGGLEEAVAKLAGELARHDDIRTGVLTLDRAFGAPGDRLPHHDRIDGVEVTRIGYRGSRRYPIAPQVIAHVRQADVVHVHAIDFFFDYLAMTRPFHRKPLVASTHGGFFHTNFAGRAKRFWFDTVTRASARRYERICASSASDAATFARIAPDNLVTIENGVDIDKWRDRAATTPTPTLLILGRFARNKRIPEAIVLLRHLRGIDPSWRLIIAGIESDLRASDLHGIACREGVADHVAVVVGASNDALGVLIGQASYILSASDYEGFGLSAVEGMSAGLYPVLNDIPPFRTLIETTGCGLLMNVDSPARAAAGIQRLHRETIARHASSRAAAIRASERYGWHDAAARFADLYRTIRRDARE